jgi:Fe-S-cluster-containing dehydrogenase component
MNSIDVDLDACNGCQICYKACFVDVPIGDYPFQP